MRQRKAMGRSSRSRRRGHLRQLLAELHPGRTQYQILNDIGATIDIHRQSAPHDELIERHQQYENP